MMGDYNTELWAESIDGRGFAMKELMAGMNIQQHIDIPPAKKTWTWRGPNKKKCYDYIFASQDFKFEGAGTDIMKRGDHRAVSITIKGSETYRIQFKGPLKDKMHSWPPTPQAAWRLSRRWAAWRPTNLDEVQRELEGAARVESERLDQEVSSGGARAKTRGVSPAPRAAQHTGCKQKCSSGARALHVVTSTRP